jgi:hypothetical protein
MISSSTILVFSSSLLGASRETSRLITFHSLLTGTSLPGTKRAVPLLNSHTSYITNFANNGSCIHMLTVWRGEVEIYRYIKARDRQQGDPINLLNYENKESSLQM